MGVKLDALLAFLRTRTYTARIIGTQPLDILVRRLVTLITDTLVESEDGSGIANGITSDAQLTVAGRFLSAVGSSRKARDSGKSADDFAASNHTHAGLLNATQKAGIDAAAGLSADDRVALMSDLGGGGTQVEFDIPELRGSGVESYADVEHAALTSNRHRYNVFAHT